MRRRNTPVRRRGGRGAARGDAVGIDVAEGSCQSTFDAAGRVKARPQGYRADWESAKKREEDTTVRASVGGLVPGHAATGAVAHAAVSGA